jgi:hypothetical protein
VTEFALERDGETVVKGRQVRSLAEDRQTQSVDTHVETPQVVSDSHAVMVKES